MDKQELENRVLNPGINNNITINGKTYIRESRALYLIDNLDEPEITTEQAWEKIAEEYKLPVETVQQIAGTTISSAVKKEDIAISDGCIILNPNLTEPEKPEKEELPDYIIEYLDNALTRGKNKNLVLENLYLELFRKDFGHFYSTSDIVLDWIGISGNATRIIDAIRNGYKPYKEPVWVVLKDAQYFRAFTGEYDESEGFEYVLAMYEGHAHTFTDKQKAEAVAILVDGTVEEWSEDND